MGRREPDSNREDEVTSVSPPKRRQLLREAVLVVGDHQRHPAKRRRAARQVVAEFLAEQDRQARDASTDEFRRWLARRVRTSACDQRVGGPNWRISS